MPSNELDKLIFERFESSRQTTKRVIVPKLGMLEKKFLVIPSNVTGAHWTVTFVFDASYIQHNIDEVDSGWLQPCFLWYCSLVTNGSQYASTEEDIPWFLNFCYSYKTEFDKPNKMVCTIRQSFWREIAWNTIFPALRLCHRSHPPYQKDAFNCGVGACAGFCNCAQNFFQNENKALWFDSKSRRDKQGMVIFKAEATHKYYMLFPEDFFEPVPTKNDLVWKIIWTTCRGMVCVVWPLGLLAIRYVATANQPTKRHWSSLSCNIESNSHGQTKRNGHNV